MNTLRIEKQGKRITLRSKTPLTGLRTAVPGAYQRVDGIWTVPLNYESCLLLQQRYRERGWKLIVGPELQRWATTVKQARKQMGKLSASQDATLHVLPIEAPKLAEAMAARTYQRVGARYVADSSDGVLIADEPGLGKTLIAMGGIVEAELPGPYLIVAPKTAARPVWRWELKRWLARHHKVITVPESRGNRERTLSRMKLDASTWVVVHPEMVLVRQLLICHECGHVMEQKKRLVNVLDCGHEKTAKTQRKLAHAYRQLFASSWGAIIADEAHETLILRSGFPTQRRRGMTLLPLRSDGKRLALSGTPFDNKPHQLFGTLNWLYPKVYTGFHRWSELYWKKGGYTGWQIGEFMKEREPMLWASLATVCLRRTKAEVAPDLPPKMNMGTLLDPDDPSSPTGIWLPMSGKQAKAYDSMLLDSSAQLKSGKLEAITALEELTRLKQLAASYGDIQHTPNAHGGQTSKFVPTLPSNKFQWTKEALEEWGFPRTPITKVIIVSFYTSLLTLFQGALEKLYKRKPDNPITAMISGRNARMRPAVIKRFNTDDRTHILLLNLRAGGTAITIDSADRMIFLTETRIPDQQLQAEDRIHRVSKPRQCMYYYLRSEGTVDVGTAVANIELAKDSHRLLDERRGVDYLRYVIEHSR